MTALLICNTAIFLFFSVIWKRSTWFNVFLKTVMIGLLFANSFALLQTLGYLIKV